MPKSLKSYCDPGMALLVAENRAIKSVKYRRDVRSKALEKLGSICKVCGFSDQRILQIDHINGGGNKENSTIGNIGVCLKVIKDPTGYQLLCPNCNWIKRVENGETRKPKYFSYDSKNEPTPGYGV